MSESSPLTVLPTKTHSGFSILNSFNLMDGLDQWLPETGPSPMALLKEKQAGKGRQRARGRRTAPVMKSGEKPWAWGDSSS